MGENDELADKREERHIASCRVINPALHLTRILELSIIRLLFEISRFGLFFLVD
jgi:hypothetical protein